MNTRYTIITSAYKGYCMKCQFSYFKGEQIRYNGKGQHLNCVAALSDTAPRTLNPKYRSVYGAVKRSLMRKLIEQETA